MTRKQLLAKGISSLFLILMLFLITPSAVRTKEACTAAALPYKDVMRVRVGWFTLPGYQYEDSHGQKTGYGYDYYQAIAPYANLEYEYVPGTWNECLERLKNGEIDVMSFVQYTPERSTYLDYTQGTIGQNYAQLTTYKDIGSIAGDNNPYTGLDGMTVACITGFAQNQQLQELMAEYGFSCKMQYYDDIDGALTDLRAKKVDLFLYNSFRKLEDGESIVAKFRPSYLYLAVPKGRDDLLDRLDYGLEQVSIHDENLLTQLKNKYFISDTDNLYQFINNHPTFSLGVLSAFLGLCILVLMIIMHNRMLYQRHLRNLTFNDPVTGLPNFAELKAKMQDEFKPKPDETYALVYSDVQNFKYINDIFGYELGNWLLTTINASIAAQLGPMEYCARFGADHFVQILRYTSLAALEERMNRQLAAYSQALEQKQIEYTLIFRTGITILPHKDIDIEKAIDSAIYAQKTVENVSETTRVLYNDAMRDAIWRERELEQCMSYALANGEFEAWYQPKYDSETGRIIAAEALVRWRHHEKGLLLPGTFIPFFEKNGFVCKLDFAVFEQVCRDIRRMLDLGLTPLPISCNFSRRHLDHWDLSQRCPAIADAYGIPHHLLEIEMTEEGAIGDPQRLRKYVDELHEAGFIFSLDDFGSGTSSVQLLYELPINVLKMDRSTLLHHYNDDLRRALLTSLVSTARANDIRVIFEGVETEADLALVQSLGGRYIQGFYFARPQPLSDFIRLLSDQQANPH
jgi:diguanylate cyclase (GGDEF)-like protein